MGILRKLGILQVTERRFARIPESVLLDSELSPGDVKAYAVLSMHVYEGNICCIGQRRIAEMAGVNRRTLRRQLTSLAKRGHISTSIVHLKRRNVYQLNSPVFGQLAAVELGIGLRPDVGIVSRPRIDNRTSRTLDRIRRVK